jgi:hypothetical protein
MAVPLLITTSRRRAISTWHCVSGKACRSLSRPPLARLLVLGRTAAPLTSLRLAQQVRLRLVRGPRHTARARPPTHAGKQISTSYGDDSWRLCRRHALAGALNANLTSRAAITTTSTSTLPHANLSPRHSSTLYDTSGPRLRLTCGKTSKYSGRLK